MGVQRNDILQDAIILLYKPSGITSNDVIQRIKKELGIKKIGHAGTLDKFAEGLLIVLVGLATKCSDILLQKNKGYRAEIMLGKETDTLDPEGKVIEEAPLPEISTLVNAIEHYKGAMEQVPPQYSAIHINGKRASKLAREGIAVDMPTRDIEIYDMKLINVELPIVEIECEVSKGTYIRSLARDIAREAGTVGYLKKLKRTKIYQWTTSQSIDIDTLFGGDILQNRTGIYSILDVLGTLGNAKGVYTENAIHRKRFVHGIQPLQLLDNVSTKQYDIAYLTDIQGLLAVWRCVENRWKLVLHA